MTTPTFRNIKAGDVLNVGYRNHFEKCEFLGFTDNKTKYSRDAKFSNYKALLSFIEADLNFLELEAYQDAVAPEYGFHFYAIFRDLGNGDVFAAYLFKGRWVLGTSADRCQLEAL